MSWAPPVQSRLRRFLGCSDATHSLAELLRESRHYPKAAVLWVARQWINVDVDGLIEQMAALSTGLFAGTERAEGPAGFAERRPAAWTAAVEGVAS